MARRIPFALRQVREHFVANNEVLLLRNGEQAFPAMLRAIRDAEHQVLLEMYWFASDSAGRRFAQALAQAAERGVEVAVSYDALGSIETDLSMFRDLVRRGVHVLEFNPIAPWRRRFRLGRVMRRNHRKVLVVDGKTGFTGGINLADAWAPVNQGGKGWRDDMLCVRGPAVGGLTACFMTTWEAEGGVALTPASAPSLSSDDQAVRVLGQNTLRERRAIVRAYLYNIYRAVRRVWIANAYFLPEPRVVRALVWAARRGVDVRVLIPARSDVEVVRIASRAMWGRLLRAGVKLYEWPHEVLHAKSAVMDGRWSTVGTFNLDYRSIFSNIEVNVAVRDEAFGRVLERSFEQDFAASRRVDFDAFKRRGFADRLLSWVLYRFRTLL